MYNIEGFFYHLLEYLKALSATGFADPVPFVVVDNSFELSIVFRLMKLRYKKGKTNAEVYASTRQMIYELPYFVKRKSEEDLTIEQIIEEMSQISFHGDAQMRQKLANDIERAYLEKEIERMYDRLAKAGCDTAGVSEKLTNLKERKKANSSLK